MGLRSLLSLDAGPFETPVSAELKATFTRGERFPMLVLTQLL